jgi:hypothetical protein
MNMNIYLPGVQLSSEGISQLMSDLGLTKFLSDDKCVYTDSVFTASYQGWTSGRYVALFMNQFANNGTYGHHLCF